MADNITDILSELQGILNTLSDSTALGSESCFQKNLGFLGSTVARTGADEHARKAHCNDEVWVILYQIIQNSTSYPFNESSPHIIEYTRLFRGVLLYARNLVTCKPQSLSLQKLVLQSFKHFAKNFSKDNDLYEKTVVVFIQLLANCPPLAPELAHETGLDSLASTLVQSDENSQADIPDSKRIVIDLNQVLNAVDNLVPYELSLLHYFNTILSADKSNETSHNVILYHVLKISNSRNAIMTFMLGLFEKIDLNSELTSFQLTVIRLLYDIITHESFGNWLISRDTSTFFSWIKLCQLIVTSKSDWNNYQLIALLSWSHDLFVKYANISIEYIDSLNAGNVSDREGPHVYQILMIILDIISDLSKFHQAKEFLTHYNTIEPLIILLRKLHENIKPVTIKDREKKIVELGDKYDDSINYNQFPQAKALIIEIISFLAHESFDTQEKVRNLHGLEIILSNCVIDENNPFIKERSIVCLKFLLANNPKNQQFVGELEAKRSYDDSALQEAGYELEVKDGNVSVKSKKTD